MHHSAQKLYVTLASLALIIVGDISFIESTIAQGVRPPTEVEVINVPDVNIANTPNVNVANSPSVEVTNSPTVQIGPGATFRDRDNPALQPVQFTCVVTVPEFDPIEGINCGGLPLGKRLVIEYINARAFVPLAQRPDMRLTISGTDLLSGPSGIEYNFPLEECGVIGSSTCYAFSDMVKLYHTDFDIIFTLGRSVGTGSTAHEGVATATVHISGHLVDNF